MTLQQTLASAHAQLQAVGIASSWLDAEILLAHTLNVQREYLTSHPDVQLDNEMIKQFSHSIDRRSGGEPVAYITGEKEFYGLAFKVTSDTLIPRPATEELVETIIQTLSKSSPVVPTKKRHGADIANTTLRTSSPIAGYKILHSPNEHGSASTADRLGEAERPASLEAGTRVLSTGNKKIIVDIGTGSGCIAVTLAKHLPAAHVIATDISDKALAVARENAQTHGVSDRITFLQGDLLNPMADYLKTFSLSPRFAGEAGQPSAFSIILVSNLPYVPTSIVESKSELQFEPKSALDGGPDGTLLYRRLLKQLTAYSLQLTAQLVALEIEPLILNPLLSAPELLAFPEHYIITHTPHTLFLKQKMSP